MLQQQKVAAEANRKAIGGGVGVLIIWKWWNMPFTLSEANEAALKEKERLAEEEAVRQKVSVVIDQCLKLFG